MHLVNAYIMYVNLNVQEGKRKNIFYRIMNDVNKYLSHGLMLKQLTI